jgi:hypothetical protein
MALKQWQDIDAKVFQAEIEKIKQGAAGSAAALAGLLSIKIRFGQHANFPQNLAEPVEETLLAYGCALDQNGGPQSAADSRLLLLRTCEILTGQLYPDQIFPGDLTGKQHQERGEAWIMDWMQARGTTGFTDWDSPAAYAEIVLALSLLIDCAESEPVWELASVLLDKVFFVLALNSYRGFFSTARRQANGWTARSGLMNETAGITRLMWGIGVYNLHLATPISLALLEKYELPPIFAQIAGDEKAQWNRESHASGTQPVNKVSYRTKDYMISSVQDYRPGQPGEQEQVWLAVLGPNAHVFTNHPAYSIDQDGLAPGFWSGNRALPRVAQWKDVLVAVYQLPAENNPLNYTHAYFPTANFDEYTLRGGWAFARVAEGYLALTASQPFTMPQHGPIALRELRANGPQVTWLCQLGSAAEDGSFEDFQTSVLGLTLSFDGQSVSFATLRKRSDHLWLGCRLSPATVKKCPYRISRTTKTATAMPRCPASKSTSAPRSTCCAWTLPPPRTTARMRTSIVTLWFQWMIATP